MNKSDKLFDNGKTLLDIDYVPNRLRTERPSREGCNTAASVIEHCIAKIENSPTLIGVDKADGEDSTVVIIKSDTVTHSFTGAKAEAILKYIEQVGKE